MILPDAIDHYTRCKRISWIDNPLRQGATALLVVSHAVMRLRFATVLFDIMKPDWNCAKRRRSQDFPLLHRVATLQTMRWPGFGNERSAVDCRRFAQFHY